MKWVSLHHHNTFSYQDGYATPAQHVARAAELGMTALAATDHGNVSAHPQHEKAAKAAGIKPIFGLEAYMHPDAESRRKFHLTLLAMNQDGYKNLMRLVSRSYSEGFYYWPTISGRMLAEHHEGLIVLSGCSDSLLSCSLLGGKNIESKDAGYYRAREVARRFKDLLGDRYYIECQQFPELKRTRQLNRQWEALGLELGIPLVGTADVHYPYPDDNEIQLILHAAGRGGGNNTVAKQAEGWEYDVRLTFPTSDRRVYDRLRATGLSHRATQEACRSTMEIAERCTVELPKAAMLRFPIEQFDAQSSEDLIWRWMREGWRYRVAQGNRRMVKYKEDYHARLVREMKDIKTKDFIDYFLLCTDGVRFAKDEGIAVGPARGSAAGSLVCYLLRITEIDPMVYPLMVFERFIDPTRTDIPDIDLDFAGNRRHEVREHYERRYGVDCVGNIANYVRYKGKNSLDDVARVHQVPKYEVETVKSMLIERSGGDSRADSTLEDTIEMFPRAKEVMNRWPVLWQAARLEGNYRGMSVHAAGLVVTNQPISDVCAMYTREYADGRRIEVVSVDKYDAEYVNMLKLDFLGLSTMEMLELALKLAGLSLEDLYRINMDDPEVIEAFKRNDVVGVFQFEGRATRLVNRDVKPDTFMELADINALARPGPLFSGTTADYIDVKHGRKSPIRWHPMVDKETTETKGQIIYQEQILKILAEVGGLPVAEVHEIRKIISKKLGEARFNESAASFAEGANRLHGIDETTARGIWARLVTAATYAFNVAHCISYSMIAVWSMWFKIHYPYEFYTAMLTLSKEDNWPRLIKDAERHGVRVRGVTPGRSARDWSISGKSIVAGWSQLKGVGDVVAGRIMEYAEQHPIRIVDDLMNIKGIGPKSVEKFRAQMESDDPFGLKRTQRALQGIRKWIGEEGILQHPTVSSDDILDVEGGTPVIWIGMVRLKEYKDIFEDERARSGRDLDDIKRSIDRPDLPTSCVLHAYDDGDEDVYVRVTRYNYPKLRKALERIRVGVDVIYVKAKKSKGGFGASLYADQIVVVDPV